MEEPTHLEASVRIVSSLAAAAEAGLTRVGEAILTEVITPPPIVGEVAAGEATAADASSDPLSQGDTHEVAVKMTGDLGAHGSVRTPGVGYPERTDYYVYIWDGDWHGRWSPSLWGYFQFW
jgi:hypothetical protein